MRHLFLLTNYRNAGLRRKNGVGCPMRRKMRTNYYFYTQKTVTHPCAKQDKGYSESNFVKYPSHIFALMEALIM